MRLTQHMLPMLALLGASSLVAAASDAERVPVYEKRCGAGSVAACVDLGGLLIDGQGVEHHETRGFKLITDACSRHEPSCACAAVVYERLCKAGRSRGCSQLAVLLFTGQGVKQDDKRALDLLAAACTAQSGHACANLGVIYLNGVGVTRDVRRGVELVERACEAQDRGGCTSLGHLYATGTGVKKDPARARKLWTAACKTGGSEACRALKAADTPSP